MVDALRILHVNKFLYRRGGAESYMLDVAELQRAAGHEVDFWGMHHEQNDPALPLSDTFAPFEELEPAPGGLRGVVAAGRMIWSRASARGLQQALERYRPDVVHMHNIYHQLSPAILGPIAAAGVRNVMTLHDYKLACPSYQMLDHGSPCDRCVGHGTWHAAKQRCKGGSLAASSVLAVESGIHRATHAYDRVGKYISPSHFLRDVMLRAGTSPDRITVLGNVADTEGVQRRQGPGAGIAFVGRLSAEKGLDTLVRAAALVADPAPIQIAGDGPERADLERLAEQVAPGRVRFLGRLPREQVGALIAGSRATVTPSRWYENQPMSILESFAADVPAIVTDLGGMPELVEDGRQGLVVPANDPAALAAAMDRLQADPDLSVRMGAAARERVETQHSAATHLAELDRIYAAAPLVGSSR